MAGLQRTRSPTKRLKKRLKRFPLDLFSHRFSLRGGNFRFLPVNIEDISVVFLIIYDNYSNIHGSFYLNSYINI